MRARVQDARALVVGSVLSGLLAYAFFVMATRTLGPMGAAPVALLWTYWSFAAAALTFPLQHWIARSVAAHGGEGPVHDALPRVALAAVGVSLATGLVAWLARNALFGRGSVAFPLLVAAVTLGSCFIGVVRGGLAARQQFYSLATALAGDNLLRVLAAGVLVIADVGTAISFGVCMAIGSLVGLAWPHSFRFSTGSADGAVESASNFLGTAAGGQLIGQGVLVGGPVLLAATGGSAEQVTALFAALAVFRVPYTLAIGLVSQLTGVLTVLIIERRRRVLRKVRLAIIGGTVAMMAVAAVLGTVTGTYLLPRIFGAGVRLDGGPSTLLAVGSVLAVANLVMTVFLMAHGRTGAIVMSWIAAVVVGGAAFILVPNEPLNQTCWAFGVAEGVALAAMLVVEAKGAARDRLGVQDRGLGNV